MRLLSTVGKLMKRAARVLPLTCLALVLMALPARAAVIYTLTVDHCTGGCGTSPFGTVTVTTTALNTVTMDISLTNSNKFVLTGQPGSTVGFNLIGDPSITLVSSTLAGWTLDSSTAGSLNFDGFGSFQYSLNCCNGVNGGGAAQTGPVSLVLTGTGLTEASFNELSTGGSPSVFFAVDILSAQTGNTGPVGTGGGGSTGGGGTTVPEPASMALFGLVALGSAFRNRRR
jgi:hypothetical protein